MSDRLILELKSKFKNEIKIEEDKGKIEIKDPAIDKMLDDILLTLHSLNYKNKEIKIIMPILINEIDRITKKEDKLSFENLLKLAMNYLDKNSSNIDR